MNTNKHIPSGNVIQPLYFHYKRGKNTKTEPAFSTKTDVFKTKKNLRKG